MSFRLRFPQSFESRLLLGLAAVFAAGLLALSLIRLREESLSFDLSSGAMRLDRYLCGFQYASEPIESHLGWLAEVEPTPRPARWLALSERHDGSLLRRPRYQRRIGQVYLDACILAQVVHGRDPARLRATIRAIGAADHERIWPLRQALREQYALERIPQPSEDRRRPTDSTTPWPRPATR